MDNKVFWDRVKRKVCTECETPYGVHYRTLCQECNKKCQEGTLDWQMEEKVQQQKQEVREKSAEKITENASTALQIVIGFFVLYVIGVTIFNAITGNTGDDSRTRTIDVDCQRDPAYCEALDRQRYEHDSQQQDNYDWARPY